MKVSEAQQENERDISDEIDIIHVTDGWHFRRLQFDEATHMSLWQCPYCKRLLIVGEFFPEQAPPPESEQPQEQEQPPAEEKEEPEMVESKSAPGVLEPNPRKRKRKEEKQSTEEQQTQ